MPTSPLPWPGLPDRPAPPPTAEALAAVAAAATPLGRWFLTPPDSAALTRLAEPGLLDAWPLSRDDGTTDRGLGLLARPHDAAAVRTDHTRLFVGPGPMAAAPYESVHTSVEGLLFEPETLDVRAWYRHYGLRAPRVGKEPDDHIGLELEFVATLAGWALVALDDGDADSAAVFASGIAGFTDAHLGVWAPGFCVLVVEEATTDFWRGVALVTQGLVTAVPDLLVPGA